MRKTIAIIISAVCLLAVIIAFFMTHFFIDGNIYSIFSESIDLSDSSIDDTAALDRCVSLRKLDLSGTGLTDVDDLLGLTELEYLNISGNDINSHSLAALCNALPECEIIYTAIIGGTAVDSRAESVILDDESAKDCTALLLLDELKYVDITACTSVTDSMLTVAQNDACDFLWQTNICGQSVLSDVSELTLDSPSEDDLQKLRLFRQLKSVTVENCNDYDTLLEISALLPECEFSWSVDLCGIELLSTDTRAVIADRPVDDLEAFSKKLAYLPSLEYIDMCRCGLTNEQMEILMERYPDIKFVWEITFGNAPVFWTVRTDITCFSSLGRIRCNDEQIEPLIKYCTDLVALDLGHHNISDLTPFSRLTKLKVLILGDNYISDLSPLASLTELQYIEIFSCKFTDISVLAELPNLIDVCIGGNNIEDITPFLSMTQLKTLWIPKCGLSTEEREMLMEALPNCTFKFTVISNLCEDWRVTDRNIAIRKAFGNWQYVVEFNNWDDVVYMEGVDLIETYPMPLH